MSGLGHQRKLRLLVATSAFTPETGCIAALLVHALTLLRRNYDLRLDHERGESAVATGDLGLPDHGGAAAMKRGALGTRMVNALSKQLGGEVTRLKAPIGTNFTLVIPLGGPATSK